MRGLSLRSGRKHSGYPLHLYIDKSSGRIRAFRLFLQKIKDPGSAGQSVLKLCDHGADIVEGLHILVCISQQYGKSTDSQMTARDQKGTCKSYTCVNDVVDTSCGWVGEAAVKTAFWLASRSSSLIAAKRSEERFS